MPTTEMFVIIGGIVGLIILCCIVKAFYNCCFGGKNSVADLELARMKGRIGVLNEINSMRVEDVSNSVRTESNLVS